VDTTSAFLSKTFDVGDLPLPTFGNCVLETGVIKWPLRQYVRFYVFFLQIQKRDFTLFDLLHALFRTLDMLAFAACGAVRAAIDRYLVSAGPTAANPPHAAASVDNWGRHSDSRRTDTVALHRPCRILHASRQWCIGGYTWVYGVYQHLGVF